MSISRQPISRRRSASDSAERGFSALELLVIVVIVCVLAAIGIPSLHARAKTTVLQANLQTLAETVSEQVLEEYSTEYRPSGEGDPEDHLSTHLEQSLGAAGYVNPVVGADGGRVILNSGSVPTDPASLPPAIFITDSPRCLSQSFDDLPDASRRLLVGTLIVAFDAESCTVEVFYVDENGRASAEAIRVPTT